jgi:thymidine kinase
MSNIADSIVDKKCDALCKILYPHSNIDRITRESIKKIIMRIGPKYLSYKIVELPSMNDIYGCHINGKYDKKLFRIGFSGLKGHGKSTATAEVHRLYKSEIISFGYYLKCVCACLYGLTKEELFTHKEARLERFDGMTPRDIMQSTGDMIRDYGIFNWPYSDKNQRPITNLAELHIKKCMNNTSVIIEDIRYPDEVDMVRKYGFHIVNIKNPTFIDMNPSKHSSERGIDSLESETLLNNGEKTALTIKVHFIIEKLKDFKHNETSGKDEVMRDDSKLDNICNENKKEIIECVSCSNKGRLEMIVGCMFSGKTTELIRRSNIESISGNKVLMLKHSVDTRTAYKISTHSNIKVKANMVSSLKQLMYDDDYRKCDVLCIDEGQFFKDLYEQVRIMVDEHGKKVIIAALDSTYKREPFMNVLNLIPHSERFDKLSAICMVCKKHKAIYSYHKYLSKAVFKSSNDIEIGGAEKYEARCRKCFC